MPLPTASAEMRLYTARDGKGSIRNVDHEMQLSYRRTARRSSFLPRVPP